MKIWRKRLKTMDRFRFPLRSNVCMCIATFFAYAVTPAAPVAPRPLGRPAAALRDTLECLSSGEGFVFGMHTHPFFLSLPRRCLRCQAHPSSCHTMLRDTLRYAPCVDDAVNHPASDAQVTNFPQLLDARSPRASPPRVGLTAATSTLNQGLWTAPLLYFITAAPVLGPTAPMLAAALQTQPT